MQWFCALMRLSVAMGSWFLPFWRISRVLRGVCRRGSSSGGARSNICVFFQRNILLVFSIACNAITVVKISLEVNGRVSLCCWATAKGTNLIQHALDSWVQRLKQPYQLHGPRYTSTELCVTLSRLRILWQQLGLAIVQFLRLYNWDFCLKRSRFAKQKKGISGESSLFPADLLRYTYSILWLCGVGNV